MLNFSRVFVPLLLSVGCSSPLIEGTYLVEYTSVETDGCTDSEEEWGVGETVEYSVSWDDSSTLEAESWDEDLFLELQYDGKTTLETSGSGQVSFTEGCESDSRILILWELEAPDRFTGEWRLDIDGQSDAECAGYLEAGGCEASLFLEGNLQ